MSRFSKVFAMAGLCALTCGIQPAKAQSAVIDVAAVVQWVAQIAKMVQQILLLESQLKQAQQTYESMTGTRGMEKLLSGVVRNYLPTDWAALQAAVDQTSAAYPALSNAVQTLIKANAVLNDAQLDALSAPARAQLVAARKAAAMLQATAQQALASSSDRFSAIQQFIDALPDAKDSKAVMDLQARIAAEQGMLINDQTKLQELFQAAQGEQWALQLRTREQVMADVGSLRELPAMGL
jgi:type IV secretion system protein VirB5